MDHRSERITEAIREELGELIGYEMADPRVANVIVTSVHISPDKKRVMVRVAAPAEAVAGDALAALEHGKSFLKRELGVRLEMYRIPELYFEADRTAMLGPRLDHLMKRIRKGRPRDATEAGPAAETGSPAGDSGETEKKAVE